jgi:hypothetical protein
MAVSVIRLGQWVDLVSDADTAATVYVCRRCQKPIDQLGDDGCAVSWGSDEYEHYQRFCQVDASDEKQDDSVKV